MADNLTESSSPAYAKAGKSLSNNDLETLRRLLLGKEYQSVLSTTKIIKDPDKLGQLIIPAISQALKLDHSSQDLKNALTPTVVSALMESVSADPKPIADALYPVMGPAIRKSISATMTQMTDNFNELLEQSVSPKAWQWRFDAWRTGRSYAEVVLVNNLVYQVEQVFLIHQKTGLLLQHVLAEDAISKDPDMVSGMLTAIQDFTSDSFSVEQNRGLNSLKLGDLTVLIENGPQAIIAAVVRGAVPSDMQNKLSVIIEKIHLVDNKKLTNYKGDSSHFDHLEPVLSACLKTQPMNKSKDSKKKKVKNKRNKLIKPAVLLSLLVLACTYGYTTYKDSLKNAEWNNIQQIIQSEPGIIITQAINHNGQFIISGLADPLAKDPSMLIKRGTLKHIKVELYFEPYLSMIPKIVLKRLQKKFNVPDSIKLKLVGNVLTLTGRGSKSWLKKFEKEAIKVNGVFALDTRKLNLISNN